MALTLPHTLTAGTNENVTDVQENFVEIANAFPVQTTNIGASQVTAAKLAADVCQVPVGAMIDYVGAGDPADTRFLLADGRAISRATYSVLYALTGDEFGAGNGTTTFNIPDLRGRVSAGLDNMGTAQGAASRITANQTRGDAAGSQALAAHSHTPTAGNFITSSGAGLLGAGGDTWGAYGTTATAGSGLNNLQPYQILNKLLRVV